jgi:hypothetical protein
MSEVRQCSRCDEVKGIADFYVHRTNERVRRRECKSCVCEKAKLKRAAKRKPKASLVGWRFGDLVVLGEVPPPMVESLGFPRKRGSRYLCACACGQATYVLGYQLKNGNTKSCGCGKWDGCAENIKKAQESVRIPDRTTAALRRVLSIYFRNAAHRQIDWSLEESAVRDMIFSDCHYCGSPPTNTLDLKHRAYRKEPGDTDTVHYNGIDRIDSARGYEDGNVVSCCKLCNTGKMNLTLPEFQDWIRRVHARLSA